ncbi:MAG: FG-GAP repeat protein, partial [Pyrinomonadaceae bacterium]
GLVHIIPGSQNGLRGESAQTLDQNTPGIGGGAEDGDQFGRSLAVGDFQADLRDDLAIGVPFEDLMSNTQADAGAVHVLFGSFNSGEMVTTEGDMFISQAELSGVSVEAGDRFGWSLAVGRFDSDFQEDLAIGSPGEDINAIVDAGIVNVLYGSTFGPSLTGAQTWHQDTANIPDSADTGDHFGYALSAWNYGKSSQSDLAIGAPFEDVGQLADAGVVTVIYGTSTGLAATAANPAQLWHQDVSGINDVLQEGDRFGHALY